MNPTLRHPLTGSPYPRGYFDPETVETLLLLACRSVASDVIEAWTDGQRAEAGNWALRTHVRASDNNRTRVPERPAHVPELADSSDLWPLIEEHEAPRRDFLPAATLDQMRDFKKAAREARGRRTERGSC